MKYYSRLIALLLAVMMFMSNVAMAGGMSVGDLTFAELESMHAQLADRRYTYNGDILGGSCTIEAFKEIIDKTGYTFEWYGDLPMSIGSGYKLTVEYTLETQTYTCALIMDGQVAANQIFTIEPAQTTDLNHYINAIYTDYDYTCIQDVRPLADYFQMAYEWMQKWNVTLADGSNLAANVLKYWYADELTRENPFADPLLCTCYLSDDGQSVTDPAIVKAPHEQHDEECLWHTDAVIIYPPMPDPIPPKDPSKFEQYTSNVKYPLAELGNRAVILPEGGRAVIETGKADGYQWQVFDGTQWVDIQGENSADFAVTDAKLNTIFELTGVAELRYFDKDNSIVLASVSVTSQEIAGGEYVDPVAEEEVQTLSLIERANSSTDTFTLTVNYWYAGTTTPVFEPYTATYPANGKVNAAITFPVVVGYVANWPGEVDTDNNKLIYSTSHTFTDYTITGNETYVVYYHPDNVGFKVLHKQQNVADDDYTTKETIERDGLTNAPVPETGLENAYPGFYKLPYSTAGLVVAADGSTEVEVFYDRYYYLVKFLLGDGGYGTDPVYDRYGAPITVTNPTRPGYTFMGWDMAIDQNGDGMVDYTDMVNGEYVVDGKVDAAPTAIPLGHQVYVAQWTAQETEYARAYWVLHEDGTKTYIGSEIVAAESGIVVSGSDTLTVNTNVCGMAEHTHDNTCEKICTLPDHVHGDGTCNYVCGKDEHNHTSGCTCTEAVHTTHTRTCYAFTANVANNSSQVYSVTHVRNDNGLPIYRNRYNNNEFYVQIDGRYYRITNYSNNTSLEYQLTCHYHTSACCSIEEHEHNAGCCSIHAHDTACLSCGAVEHTHGDGCKTDLAKYVQFVDADQNVTVEGDGSSIVNVNYEYKTYTIRFIYARQNGTSYNIATLTRNGVLTNCDWGESGSTTLPTFKDPSGKTERSTVRIGNYTYYYISLTAKYGEDIADIWPSNNIGAVGDYKWGSWAAEYGTGYRVKYGDEHANIVGPYPIMSADMIVDNPTKLEDGTYLAQNMIAWWGHNWNSNIDLHAYHNYFELLPGEQKVDGETYLEHEGKTYKLVQTYTFTAAHNGSTRVDPIYFNGYHCVNDTRDTTNDKQANSNNYANNVGCGGDICGSDCTFCQNFFYERNGHKLYFWNHNGYLQEGTGANVVYGEVLTKYGEYVKEDFMAQPENYPEGLEANAYQFAGWYTTADCLDGTEVDWNATMPDADMTFYAKWEPVTHKVNFFLDRTQMENYLDDDDETIGAKYIAEVGVKHDEYVDDTLSAGTDAQKADLDKLANEQVDANYKNGVYTFIGWFYMDSNGKEKMFDPFDMQVKKDLNLYGKWSSNELVSYTINYVDKDTKEVIADQMVGSALAGSTKTFDAKTGPALKDGYQSGYFPIVPSHSITMDLEDASKNVYTFEYIQKEAVPYTVYYLSTDPSKVEQTHGDPIVLKDKEGKDVTYYQIAAPKTESKNTQSYVTENYLPITGYLPDKYQKSLAVSVNADGTPNIDANKIYFFYEVNENSINYKVIHYIEDPKGTHVNSDVDVPSGMKWSQYGEVQTKPGISGQTVTESPLSIPNYTYQEKYSYYSDTPVAGEELTLRLYYTENEAKIKYVPVGPGGAWDGSGTAYVTNSDKATEETVEVITGSPTGATADADDPTYKFVGWYDNAACTGTPISTAGVFQPTKAENAVWPATTTYYAKFEYNLTSMKIQKAGALDTNDTFIFTVKGYGLPENGLKIMVAGNGYAIINGLTVGQVYTVEEDASWSWRYTAQYAEGATVETSHALVPDTTATADNHPNTVTITNTQNHPYWLDGSAYKPNQFGEN